MRASLDWIFDGNPPLLKATYNHSILKRLYFIIESGDNGRTSIDAAASVLKSELIELWTYAGYGDILQDSSFIIRKIRSLSEFLKNLNKTPHSRRSTPAFLKKESTFLATLPKLFDITVQSLRFSGKVTQEDRDFLLNHWWKPITSTPDVKLRNAFEKKLEREAKHQFYLQQQDNHPSTSSEPSSAPHTASTTPSSDNEYQPASKRQCITPRVTTLHLPCDILQRVGSTAD